MNDEIRRFANLLISARPILEKMNDADQLRPPTFNIFNVLKLDRYEQAHSAVLAYLLDSRQGHNQGTLFLEAFVELLRAREKALGAPSQLPKEVTREWSCHPELCVESGRLDILIRAPSSMIVIENKIYAQDGYQQLHRYWRYARTQNMPYLLVYLTPHGTRPSPGSVSGPQVPASVVTGHVDDCLEKHLILLSYRTDIRLWMQRMAEKVPAVSVAEVLRQYANMVGRL
jgi:hypothetical protein